MHNSLRKWLQVSFFNLMLVALAGVILRYKIAFPLPLIDQKYLLHGHSHFAFAGWITQVLMVLLVANLSEKKGISYFRKYRGILYANLFAAYGMLLTFPVFGYGLLSILFSTLSVFISWIFAARYWSDLNKLPISDTSHSWFKLALVCSVLSAAGPFSLAYMMATKNIQQNYYLASIYYFLHFQYNGWFFFGCMGLFSDWLQKLGTRKRDLKRVFQFFALACLPTYFLSLLWWPLPAWLYTVVVLSVLLQLCGLFLLVRILKKQTALLREKISGLSGYLLGICAVALAIKLGLQTASVIPSLSKLAFGFRPIVIGYLHLVLLGLISMFILGYCVNQKYIVVNRTTRSGILIFAIGIVFNEGLLMILGLADLNDHAVPFMNELLLGVALMMFAGILITNYGLSAVKRSVILTT